MRPCTHVVSFDTDNELAVHCLLSSSIVNRTRASLLVLPLHHSTWVVRFHSRLWSSSRQSLHSRTAIVLLRRLFPPAMPGHRARRTLLVFSELSHSLVSIRPFRRQFRFSTDRTQQRP